MQTLLKKDTFSFFTKFYMLFLSIIYVILILFLFAKENIFVKCMKFTAFQLKLQFSARNMLEYTQH